MIVVFLGRNECTVEWESLFLSEQVQKQVVSLKSSEVYLSIDTNMWVWLQRRAREKMIQKRCVLWEFSATEGSWLSEQSSPTYGRILSVKALA